MISPLPNHARIDRHFAVELFCEAAKQDIARYCKQAVETSNRSFGQMIRQHERRMSLLLSDDNLGDA